MSQLAIAVTTNEDTIVPVDYEYDIIAIEDLKPML
jgi:hypothetical protein